MSKSRAPGRKHSEWDRLVDEWLSSGEKQGKFAEAHGINPKTFQGRVSQSRKRRGLGWGRKESRKHRGLATVQRSKESKAQCQFVEVSPIPTASRSESGACRITIQNTTIEFMSGSDTGWMAEVLKHLGHIGR